jgi:hypothetical protein
MVLLEMASRLCGKGVAHFGVAVALADFGIREIMLA